MKKHLKDLVKQTMKRFIHTRIRTQDITRVQKCLVIKTLFRKSDGKLLGAQVLGEDGVPKRIDSFAMAIQMGCTIYDLEESELCYAPPYGSAKDPVNFAGMVAADVLRR